MKKNNVLLVANSHSKHLEQVIIDYAKQVGWNLEIYYNNIPDGWYGDGVILDSATWQQVKNVINYETIPIVSRCSLPAGKNRRLFLGNTKAIAKLVSDYFISLGFKNFCSFSVHPPMPGSHTEIAKVMPDWALKEELEKHSYQLNMLCLGNSNGKKCPYHYATAVKHLSNYIQQQPKPCACFTNSSLNVHLFYRACQLAGIKVPQEVAFLANNDMPRITEYSTPTTSAVFGEIRNIGIALARTLDDLMAGNAVPEGTKLLEPSGIIYRQSTDILAVPDARARKAIDFIFSNYMKPISLSEAADAADLQPNMMNYLFKKYIDKTPGSLLNEIRMNKARKILLQSTLSLAEIAKQIGYGSAMSFHLAFKREHGMTPGNYRTTNKC